MHGIEIRCVRGPEIEPYLADLARLRIQVFRDWPYRYDGDLAYERKYLATYAQTASALLVLALDGATVVGASSALALADEVEELRAPIRAAGLDEQEICYFGESVLDSRYRGRGVGKAFFRERLGHARDLGARIAAFAAVRRAPDDPNRPADAQNLEPLWRSQGFLQRPDLIAWLAWRELGEAEESPKPLMFWLRLL